MRAVVDPGIAPDRAFDILDEYGYLIVRKAIDQAIVEGMRREFRPFLDATPPCTRKEHGLGTRRFKGAFTRSRAYHAFAMDPLILALADRILLPHCTSYTLSGSDCFEVGPGSDYQPLHRDDMLYPVPHPHYEYIFNVMVAISDFTEENGATRVIPYSHRWPDDRRGTQEEAISAAMPSGSILVIFGSTVHGAGRNATRDEFRMSANATYNLGWLRQQENQYLFAPPDVARTLGEPMARLIGYQTHQPHLGQVHIEKDLYTLLEPGGERDIAVAAGPAIPM